jgi:uncharacterized membrane protein
MDTFLGTVHGLAWAVYVGGALIMELVLRHAQVYMRPSQVGVVCQRAGQRYRWWALASLAVLGFTGALMVLRLDGAELAARAGSPALSLDDSYGRTLVLLAALWLVLLAIVGEIAFRVHPAMHARVSSSMSEEQVRRERRRMGAAIQRMNRLLRLELAGALLALALGTTLRLGGIA